MMIQPNIVTKGANVPGTAITGTAVGAFISTNQPNWNWKVCGTNTSYAAYATLGTKPALNVLYESSNEAPTLIRVMPFTDVSTITAGSIRIVAWSKYLDGSTEDWIPSVLTEITLSRTSGTSLKNTISASDYYPWASMTSVAGGQDPIKYSIGSMASFVVDTMGAQLVEVTATTSSGNMGVLWTVL